MNRNPGKKTSAVLLWAALVLPVLWLALIAGGCCGPGVSAGAWLEAFTAALNHPLAIRWTAYTPKALLLTSLCYGFAIALYYSSKGNKRPGEEHGSAQWGNPRALCAKYQDREHQDKNILLTQHVRMGMDG